MKFGIGYNMIIFLEEKIICVVVRVYYEIKVLIYFYIEVGMMVLE